NREPERLRGLRVDDQLEFGGLLDRKVTRLRAFENLVHVGRRASKEISQILAVAQKAARLGKLSTLIDRGQSIPCRQIDDLPAVGVEECRRQHVEGLGALTLGGHHSTPE